MPTSTSGISSILSTYLWILKVSCKYCSIRRNSTEAFAPSNLWHLWTIEAMECSVNSAVRSPLLSNTSAIESPHLLDSIATPS